MYIAIDIGGTNTRIAVAANLSSSTFISITKFNTNQNYERGLRNIIDSIEKISENPLAISIGFAGRINEANNTIAASYALSDWVGKPLSQTLSKHFNCSVYLRNDALMGAFGEAYYDLELNHDFIYLTWGAGIGGAIVEKDRDVVNGFVE